MCICLFGCFSQWRQTTMPLLFAKYVQSGFQEEKSSRETLIQKISYIALERLLSQGGDNKRM